MGSIFSSSKSAFNRKVSESVKKALGDRPTPEWANEDVFTKDEDLDRALHNVGLESSNLIFGIDFTQSNQQAVMCAHSFGGRSLHTVGVPGGNPYEQVIEIMGKALAPYDDDGKIPAFGFGDLMSRHTTVTEVGPASGCEGFAGVLTEYKRTLQRAGFKLSGPTSFAPVINRALDIVRQSRNRYHILLLIGDGGVSTELGCKDATKEAIVAASEFPLSIVMVGVGDGPWDDMHNFDNELPERKFDNFQFVEFTEFASLMKGGSEKDMKIASTAFKMCALMEIPAQYRAIRELGLLENVAASTHGNSDRRGEIRQREEDAESGDGAPSVRRARLS